MKEWGPKSSVCPSKPGTSNFFSGISRDFAAISRRCPKSLRKKSLCSIFGTYKLWCSGSEKGVFWKRGLSEKSSSRDSGEFRDSRDSREPSDSGKQRRTRPFSRDSRDFRKFRDSSTDKTPFLMTRFPVLRYVCTKPWFKRGLIGFLLLAVEAAVLPVGKGV